MLAVQVGQQALEVEMHIAFARLGLQTLLIGHHEVAQTINHMLEHVGGNDAIAQ